jgi:nucleotide-binding universal stress UspA family protein
MKILLAVDGSAFSEAAIDEVGQLPWPSHSEIRVITAAECPVIVGLEPWAATPIYFEQLQGAVRDSARSNVEQAVTKLKARGPALRISCAVIEGPPCEIIVDEAEKWGADMIVMGSRGLGAWSRVLLGSVSNAVAHHANCSVLIVRKHKNSRPEKK